MAIEQAVSPPSKDQKKIARSILNPLTGPERMAIYAVIAYEVYRELKDS